MGGVTKKALYNQLALVTRWELRPQTPDIINLQTVYFFVIVPNVKGYFRMIFVYFINYILLKIETRYSTRVLNLFSYQSHERLDAALQATLL